MMLYMLFYYTEALGLPIATAAACYALASVWDGIVSLAAGILVDRKGGERNYRLSLIIGAVPLGLCFVLAYLPSPFGEGSIVIWVLASQILLRTIYALVNIPYLAMSARISLDSNDRALIAGGRMIAGTLAAVVVAIGTVPIGRWLTGNHGPQAYAAAAIIFSLMGSIILIGVGLAYREDAVPQGRQEGAVGKAMLLAWRNRAFVTLAAAMTAMIVAVSMLDKSVLYYFKYSLGDQGAGELALGAMMAVSGIAVPVWLLISRAIGVRALWFVAVGLGIADLAIFIVGDLRHVLAVQAFLVVVQVATIGLNFAVWAMLPDTIEFGQRQTGIRVEAVLYGYVALLQRLAIGLGTLLMGLSAHGSDFSGDASSDAAFRLTIAVIPLLFFLLSGALMLLNPLHQGTHEKILDELPH